MLLLLGGGRGITGVRNVFFPNAHSLKKMKKWNKEKKRAIQITLFLFIFIISASLENDLMALETVVYASLGRVLSMVLM